MKLFKIFLLAAALLCALTAAAQTDRQTREFVHTVAKGESLYSIAGMYNVTVGEIVRMNPGCEKLLRSGSKLRIPQSVKPGSKRYHTIKPGETLYRLTVMYNVPANEICKANPGLSDRNFKAGSVIIIPLDKAVEESADRVGAEASKAATEQWQDMHKIKRRETVYSISRKYGITEEELIEANPEIKGDKLKKGKWLRIPFHKDRQAGPDKIKENIENQESDSEIFAQNRTAKGDYSVINACVILPFMAADSLHNAERERMVEYYEGFLMAADSLKKEGVSLDISTYDSGHGTSTIKRLIREGALDKADIIFGPAYPDQTAPLAEFAKRNKTKLVIPFTSKGSDVFSNPEIYQINTPQSYLYSEVFDNFVKTFPDTKVVFLDAATGSDDKDQFVSALKDRLKAENISYDTVSGENISPESVIARMDTLSHNVLIPTSGKNVALIKLLPQLLVIRSEHPAFDMHLFGYPEWQTYTHDHLASFYELDTYFYSSFYTNQLFPEAVRFTKDYRKWYGRDIANTYPSYAMLGFDTAYYILSGLSRYGNTFEDRLYSHRVTPIQTGFRFERVSNWGGFINKMVFFVHFTKDYELIKLNFE